MDFRKRSNAYWEKRAEEQLTLVEKQSIKHLKDIDRVYLDARRYTANEVKKLYVAYYTKNGLDTQVLNSLAPRGDIRRFIESVAKAGLITELPDGYGFRLTRLQLLEANIWLEASKAAKQHTLIQTLAHKETIETAYNYAMYTLSKGTGVVPLFAQLNTRTIDRILATKFYGKNYSERIWTNRAKLIDGIKRELATAVTTGQSNAKTARMIRDKYNVTRYEASRLVRTETNHFNALGSTESYMSAGLDEWVYSATLDGRTSEICQELDNRRFKLTDTEHKPPQHPNCRSCMRPYLGKEYEPDTRIMRDPTTGENRYISNMSYKEWRELYL